MLSARDAPVSFGLLLGLASAVGLSGCSASPLPAARRSRPVGSEAAPAPISMQAAGGAAAPPDAAVQARRRVAQMLQRVAAFRHLAPRSSVESSVLPRAELLARVREHVRRQIPREVIESQGEFLIGLGLVPPDFDYEAGTLGLLEGELAGFYEPSDKTMYLAADLPEPVADATLAHELVHALQDQYYDLGGRLSYQPEGNDRESAVQAMAEGDATSAMMDVILAEGQRRATDVPDDLFAAGVEASLAGGPEGMKVPRVLRASLVVPYVDGVRFVHALRRRGDWGAVDDAWRVPPETTEQLLHLDKFDAREKGEEVPAAAPPEPQGWKAVYDDVFGEQGLRIAMEEWTSKRVAAGAAAGWGGDRGTVFRAGARFAVAWQVRFDAGKRGEPDAEAQEAFRAVAAAIRRGATGGGSVCTERGPLGPWAVARKGRDVVIVAGPYRREGARVDSDAVCAQTTRWAADILGRRSR